MSRTLLRLASPGVVVALLTLNAPHAHAGQVRVTVGAPTNTFTNYQANVNLGDHVTWVWATSGHTVTSWTLPTDSMSLNADGSVFDSDAGGLHLGQPSSTRWSWKSDRLGHVPYVCVPHAPDMSGRVIVHNPSNDKVDVADFRISEVQYNVAAGLDLIEITNYGLATGNLGRFRITTTAATTELVGPAGATNDIIVPSNGRVTVHLNAAGVNSNTDVFIATFAPGTGLPNSAGALSLYVPNTIAPGNSTSNAAMMIDFVQWGAGGQSNEATAVTAGFWGSGNFVPQTAAGHSIEYCPDANLSHGDSRWAEVSTPNFGSDGQCLTPVMSESWGRLKIIYR